MAEGHCGKGQSNAITVLIDISFDTKMSRDMDAAEHCDDPVMYLRLFLVIDCSIYFVNCRQYVIDSSSVLFCKRVYFHI